MSAAQAEFDFTARPPAPEPRRENVSAERLAEIAEKIKKLLRLARGTTAAESALALQRAFELANRFGIDTSRLNLDEQAEPMLGEYFHCGERPDFLRRRIIVLCMTYFRVEACLCGPRVLFVGRQSDVQIAGYVYEFLVRAGGACLRSYVAAEHKARRVTNTEKRTSFVQGFVYAISQQLDEAKAQIVLDDARSALVVAEKHARKAKLDELIPDQVAGKTERPIKRHQGALVSGFVEGEKTKIHQPLNGAHPERLALA